MSAIPVHDLQVYDRIDSADGQWSDHGDDRWGPELRAKGGGSYSTLYSQKATPHGNTSAVVGIVEAKNTGDTPADGYHGLGLSIIAYKRIGSNLKEVWNNDLLTDGNIEHWLTDLTDRWSRGSVVVQIPDDVNPDFIDSAWVYKTASNVGKVRIDSVGLYDHYSRVYRTPVRDKQFTGFTSKTAYGIIAGRDYLNMPTRFVDSYASRISKGQHFEVQLEVYVNLLLGAWPNETRPSRVLCWPALKLLSNEGPSDWALLPTIGTVDATGELINNEAISSGRSFIASRSYFQVEVYFLIVGAGQPHTYPYLLDVKDMMLTLSINDQKETGST